MIGKYGEGEERGQGKRGTEKKKRKPQERPHNPRSPADFDAPEGYSATRIRFLRAIMPKEPLEKDDLPEMRRRFDRYLELCEEYDVKPSNMSAYMAIGITPEEASKYEHMRGANPECCQFYKEVRMLCASFREIAASEGQIRDAVAIFWQKNWDGFRDVQETVVTKNDPLGDVKAIEALKDRYLPPIEPKKIVDVSAVDVDESTE